MTHDWSPSRDDALFILAMDQRDSFAELFHVGDDASPAEEAHLREVKRIIFAALVEARGRVDGGRPAVLVDQQYGEAVIDDAHRDGMPLAVPIEASGEEWFETAFGDEWLAVLRQAEPDWGKVLVRDNPDRDPAKRREQFTRLHGVGAGLAGAGIPFLYELLVPATDRQLAAVGGDADRYDAEVRADLVVQVIADNYAAGIEPALWKVEGLESADDARKVVAAARAGGRDCGLIVLGRDAPQERLDHWLRVAKSVEGFVGFAIGRSNWEDVVRDLPVGSGGPDQNPDAVRRIAENYLHYVSVWNEAL